MHMNGYAEILSRTLLETSSLGDERTQEVARSLLAALDPALRLVALQMLTDAAEELNDELDGERVTVVMDGPAAHFMVTRAVPEEARPARQEPAAPERPDREDQEVRTTLRLPGSLKRDIDAAAQAQGRSLNAWMIEAARDALTRTSAAGPDGASWGAGRQDPGAGGSGMSGSTLRGWLG